MRPVPGTVLGGRYVLTERIAIGGMGEVWKGRDDVLGRQVAAKILKEEYVGESNFLERFRAEARTMGSVSHPGIAGVYDYGEEDGSPYLVMEFVPGEPLSTLMERERPLGVDRTLNLVTQAALALNAAHLAGVVHRDIKPGNILVTPEGVAKLTDFGIARMVDQAPLTKTGQVMGTAQYLAPEQATGKPSIPASDLYALGIIAYEALAGHRPFQGDSQIAIAMAQVNENHPPLPDSIPDPVRRLVDALLQKKPEYRPSDAAKVAEAATALRRGDVAAAEAAVPQMIPGWQPGADASEATTRAFNQAEANRTQLMGGAVPAAAGAGAGAWAANRSGNTPPYGIDSVNDDDERVEDPEEKKSSTGRKVGITLLILLGLAVVAAIVFFLLNPGGNEEEPLTTPTPTVTESTPEAIEIDPDDYIGQTESTATSEIEDLGLEVRTVEVESNETAGTVADVSPGNNGYTYNEGDTVTLEISTGPAEPEPAPTVEPTEPEPEPTQPETTEPEPEPSDSPSEDTSDDETGIGDGNGNDETGNGNGGGNGNGNGGNGNGNGNGSENN